MKTGYFVPSNGVRWRGLVHYVVDDKPICGSKIGAKSVFQWCTAGKNPEILECKKCRKQSPDL